MRRTVLKMNNAGISLVEILMAGGVMTVMGLAFGAMMVNSAKNQRNSMLETEMTSLQSLLVMTMAKKTACEKAFPAGQVINESGETAVPQIQIAGRTLSMGAPNNIYNGWILTDMKFSAAQFGQDLRVGDAWRKLYTASLLLSFQKTDAKLGTVPRKLAVPVKVFTQKDSSTIAGCTGESDLMKSACDGLGGDYVAPAPPAIVGDCVPQTPLSGTMKKLADTAVTEVGTKICSSIGVAYMAAGEKCDYGNNGTKTFAEYIRDLLASTTSEVKVNGGWGATTWGACSCPGTSVTGTQSGTRVCNNPLPSGGGADCEGSPIVTQNCPCTLYAVGSCEASCMLTKETFVGKVVKTSGAALHFPRSCSATLLPVLGKCIVTLKPTAGATTESPTTELQGTCTQNAGEYQVTDDPEDVMDDDEMCVVQKTDTCSAKCTATNTLMK